MRERLDPLRRPRDPLERLRLVRLRVELLRRDELRPLRRRELELRLRLPPEDLLRDVRADFFLLLSGMFTPDRRALDNPMAMACLRFLTVCLPLRAWCISSRTYSPACVPAEFPLRLCRAALCLVRFSGIMILLFQTTRSVADSTPVSCAQWAQQKKAPWPSTP